MEVRVAATPTPGLYDVTVSSGGQTTRHRVSVPPDPHTAGLPAVGDKRLVQESFAFLLEREPPSAILAEFDLPVIGRYFPDYGEQMQRRLS